MNPRGIRPLKTGAGNEGTGQNARATCGAGILPAAFFPLGSCTG